MLELGVRMVEVSAVDIDICEAWDRLENRLEEVLSRDGRFDLGAGVYF